MAASEGGATRRGAACSVQTDRDNQPLPASDLRLPLQLAYPRSKSLQLVFGVAVAEEVRAASTGVAGERLLRFRQLPHRWWDFPGVIDFADAVGHGSPYTLALIRAQRLSQAQTLICIGSQATVTPSALATASWSFLSCSAPGPRNVGNTARARQAVRSKDACLNQGSSVGAFTT